MKVSFTAKEYARLLELAHLGLQVAGAQAEEPDTIPERYAAVAQKVFGLAEVFGCTELVEMDEEGRFVASAKLAEGLVQEKMEKFVDDMFWGELAARLAERDLRSELGATKLSDDLNDEETEKLAELEDGYWREFEVSGVDHLHVLRGGRG